MISPGRVRHCLNTDGYKLQLRWLVCTTGSSQGEATRKKGVMFLFVLSEATMRPSTQQVLSALVLLESSDPGVRANWKTAGTNGSRLLRAHMHTTPCAGAQNRGVPGWREG